LIHPSSQGENVSSLYHVFSSINNAIFSEIKSQELIAKKIIINRAIYPFMQQGTDQGKPDVPVLSRNERSNGMKNYMGITRKKSITMNKNEIVIAGIGRKSEARSLESGII
jgi:hypothetical protein